MPLALSSLGNSRASPAAMPSSSACACWGDTPGFRRPITRIPMPTPRSQKSGSAHCPMGTTSDTRRNTTSSPGTTPITVYSLSLSVMLLPSTAGEPPNRDFHKPDVRTATGAAPR